MAKKNFVYNLLYQLLVMIIPLVTAPYLARIIGSDGVGIYSYTYSIAYYFMLLTLLGVNNYGNRTIAKVRENKEELSKNFVSIYLLQFTMGLIMIILYFLYVVLFCESYKLVSILQSFYIISAMIDINWFFFGLEEFKKTIARNAIVKISTVILIFVFVKNKSDLWKYTIIVSGMTCLSQAILWAFLKNKIIITKIHIKDIFKHIKPNLILFLPVIAVSLYKMMDKIMLGNITNMSEVGFYENAEKIINIPMIIITALGTVMLPRMSNIAANGDKSKIKEMIEKSEKFILFISFAMCFGLIGIGQVFAPLFFGKDFTKTGTLILFLSITLPFVSFANVLRTQYLIPNEKDKDYITSVFLGVVVNLLINYILIPKYLSVGACIGTILAEFTVAFYQAFSLRKVLDIKRYLINGIEFFWKALLMFIFVYIINFIDINLYIKLIVQIFTGICVYFCLNYKYINSLINIKKYSYKLFRLLKNNSA